jgi:hypothetical protein
VRLIATIRLAESSPASSGPNAASVLQTLEQTLGTLEAASAALSIEVVGAPTIEQTTLESAEQHTEQLLLESQASQLGMRGAHQQRAVPTTAVALGVVVAVALLVASVLLWRRRRWHRRGAPNRAALPPLPAGAVISTHAVPRAKRPDELTCGLGGSPLGTTNKGDLVLEDHEEQKL